MLIFDSGEKKYRSLSPTLLTYIYVYRIICILN